MSPRICKTLNTPAARIAASNRPMANTVFRRIAPASIPAAPSA